jgi:hypothetical protein
MKNNSLIDGYDVTLYTGLFLCLVAGAVGEPYDFLHIAIVAIAAIAVGLIYTLLRTK